MTPTSTLQRLEALAKRHQAFVRIESIDLRALLRDLAEAKAREQVWIACSERMPEPDRYYLVAHGPGPDNVTTMRLDSGKFMKRPKVQWKWQGQNSPLAVTHWMEQPAGPAHPAAGEMG